MKKLTMHLRGTHAVLAHNPEAMGRSKDGLGKKEIPTPKEEAEAAAYVRNGCFVGPAMGLRNGMVVAARGRRINKKSAPSIVQGTVFPTSEWAVLLDPGTGKPLKGYEIDTRRAVVQRAAVFRSRPKFDPWATTYTVEFEDDLIAPGVIVELQGLAGRLVGWMDYRPQKNGPFGRYFVEWYEVEGQKRVVLEKPAT